MSFISKAFHHVFHSVEHAFKDLGQVAKGLVTLDLGRTAKGLSGLASDALEIADGVSAFTPASLAANTLLDLGLDQLLQSTLPTSPSSSADSCAKDTPNDAD